ncbi:CapA family protein [Caulobacter sp. SL161]|uniref:CapA family protein n=1 Tax=Caulobacter sp. SL161 TaxID=2995156 RepID=UPI00227334EE|nr:CapA family protein [Caulobacter sp. SL161]MCY1647634.1 CapA family protein [Caulobacter sp. SL161]
MGAEMDRRSLLLGALGLAATPTIAKPRRVRLALVGQALIEHAPTDAQWPGRRAVARALARADLGFTNLETVIKGPRAGAPTREALTLHAGEPAVLDALKAMDLRLLATANNHAFDLGSGGILDTVDAIERAGLVSAGSGRDLARAAAPAYAPTPAGPVALVAFATGKVREGGAATMARPGVNELRRDASGLPREDDAERVLAAIADAKRRAEVVIAYQHNHDWEPNQADVPAWQRAFAHRCVAAGASVFVGHGAPLLQGIEIHDGAPLFFGLGNFIFQTEKPPGAYAAECWESVIVQASFERGRCQAFEMTPIVMNEIGLGGPEDMATRGMPTLASPSQARIILDRMNARSLALGSAAFDVRGSRAVWTAPLKG